MASPEPDTRLTRLCVAIIVLWGAAAYCGGVSGEFLFDDHQVVGDNASIRQLWPIWRVASIERGNPISGRWMANLTFAADYAVHGLDVRGYHIANIGLHILAGLLLFGVLRRTLGGTVTGRDCHVDAWHGRLAHASQGHLAPASLNDSDESTGVKPVGLMPGMAPRSGAVVLGLPPKTATLLGGAIALIWLLHPIQTESVTYISQRMESLMGVFLLGMLYCVIRGSASGRAGWWYGGAVACCAGGMGCKEAMAVAPILVLLYDRTFLSGGFLPALRRRRWLYVGLAATGALVAMTLLAQSRGESAGLGRGIGSLDYLKTQAGVLLHYARLACWPDKLVLDYDWPIARSAGQYLPQGIAILLLLAATVWGVARNSPWGFLGAWCFAVLAPSSSFIPVVTEIAAEHRMYLPLAAFATAVVIGAWAAGRLVLRIGGPQRPTVVVGAVALASVLGALTFLTVQRNADYRTEMSIWADNVAKGHRGARVVTNLGALAERNGRGEEAICLYQEAARIDPRYAPAWHGLGYLQFRQGRYVDSLPCFDRVIELRPSNAAGYCNKAAALMALGRAAEAAACMEKAVSADADSADCHCGLATAMVRLGRIDEAVTHYRRALELRPADAETCNFLGLALIRLRRYDAAADALREALRLKPALADARNNLAFVLAGLGRKDEAMEQYELAIQADPNRAEFHCNLGALLAESGRAKEAVGQYRQAVGLQQDYVAAMNRLASVLATSADGALRDGPEAVRLAERLCELSDWKNVNHLNTLAASYAETGQFARAVATIQKAIEAAGGEGPQVRDALEQRLKLYEGQKPLRLP